MQMETGGQTRETFEPSDPEQWADVDMDGYGDNYLYDVDNQQYHINQRGDAF